MNTTMPTNELTETAIQGMMMAEWDRGTRITVNTDRVAVCLDGVVWEIQDRGEHLLGTVNPTVAADSEKLQQQLKSIGSPKE